MPGTKDAFNSHKNTAKKKKILKRKSKLDQKQLKIVNCHGTELVITHQEETEEEKKAPVSKEPVVCQWTTLLGGKCKRDAGFHINLIENGKIMKIVPVPKSIDRCCSLCTQHLLMALGLTAIGIAHLLWKRSLNMDDKMVYEGSMMVSVGSDYNAFKEIYKRMQTNTK